MKQHENNDWLEGMLSQKLKKQTGDFDFQQWRRKYPNAAGQLGNMQWTQTKTKTSSWSLTWRMIMKSPYTKYGTIAAGVLLAVVFLFPLKDITPSSILLGDVQKKLLGQHNCIINGTRILTVPGDDSLPVILTVHKYLSREYGYVDQTFDEEGNLLIWLSVHHPSNAVTVLFPQIQRYTQIPVTEQYRDKMKEITLMKLFRLFFCEGDEEDMSDIDLEKLDITTLDGVKKSKINGVDVVGFDISALPKSIEKLGFNTLPLFFDMQRTDGYIWIDPDTLLPVRLDADVDIGKCILTNYREMTLSEVDEFAGWNVEMDETMFRPPIPEGYQLLSLQDFKNMLMKEK